MFDPNQASGSDYQLTDVAAKWQEMQRIKECLEWHHKDTISKIQSMEAIRWPGTYNKYIAQGIKVGWAENL